MIEQEQVRTVESIEKLGQNSCWEIEMAQTSIFNMVPPSCSMKIYMSLNLNCMRKMLLNL